MMVKKKPSIYSHPFFGHRQKLDPSQIQDRRSEKPLRRRDYPNDEAYKGGMQTIGAVNRAVRQATYGAQDTEATAMRDVPLPKRKNLPPWAQGPAQNVKKKRPSAAEKAVKQRFGL